MLVRNQKSIDEEERRFLFIKHYEDLQLKAVRLYTVIKRAGPSGCTRSSLEKYTSIETYLKKNKGKYNQILNIE